MIIKINIQIPITIPGKKGTPEDHDSLRAATACVDADGSTWTALSWLDLRNNQVSELHPLSKLSQLTKLFLSRNNIADIHPLAGLHKLQWLRLDSNNITNIDSLASMKNLVTASVTNNSISFVEWPNIAPSIEIIEAQTVFFYHQPQNPRSIFSDVPGLKKREIDFDAELLKPNKE